MVITRDEGPTKSQTGSYLWRNQTLEEFSTTALLHRDFHRRHRAKTSRSDRRSCYTRDKVVRADEVLARALGTDYL